MKLSIIVPVYNAEKFLDKCLDSLVNQTIEDYEIILINDGSKDSSLSIMESYREKYPELIKTVSVKNGGQGRARNIGIRMAKGDYIGFADSDDWVSPHMYKTMYDALTSGGGDLAICDAVKCFYDGRTELNPLSQYERIIKIDTSVWNKLFKRELLENIEFPEDKLWYEDLPFVIKASLRSEKQIRINEGLYYYRIGQISTMNNNNSFKNLDIIIIMNDLKDYLLEKGFKNEFESLLINHVLLDAINRVNMQQSLDKKKVMKSLSAYVRTNIPEILECSSYKKENLNRRIIMYLNYHNLTWLSKFLLNTKKKFK